jgi:hypothetical protein
MARTRVDLSDLLLAVDHVSLGGFGDTEAYVALDTGMIHVVGDGIESDDPDAPDGSPDPTDFSNSDQYLQVPSKQELGLGKRLAVRFAWAHLDEGDAVEVEGYFRRRGAYPQFKALLERRQLLKQWYEYEDHAIRQEVKDWCEGNDLEVYDDKPAP